MTNYKELADRLSAFINDALDAVDEAAEILRSLEVRPLYAAPVAAQPQQAKPEPLSDADYYEIGQRYSIPTVKIQAIHRELEAKRGIKEQG